MKRPNPFLGNRTEVPQTYPERLVYAAAVMKIAARGCPVFWGERGEKRRNLQEAAYVEWRWDTFDYALPEEAKGDFPANSAPRRSHGIWPYGNRNAI